MKTTSSNTKSSMRVRGFTLIEVLISLVIIAIGITALLQLQGVFLESASDAEKRALAVSVGEKKLESLREFDNITSGAQSYSGVFDEIDSGSGQEIVSFGSASITYDLNWVVEPFNIASGGTITAASVAGASFKQVKLIISWGSSSSTALSTIIGGINPQLSAFADKAGFGGDSPSVAHNPGVAPDVIAIDVGGGLNKETSKPIPDVEAKNDSTVVKFETVTYRQDNDELSIKEDFLTVNCQCDLKGLGTAISPSYSVFINEKTGLVASGAQIVPAYTGSVKSLSDGRTQSEYCSRCCANHHDSVSPPGGIRYVNDGVASDVLRLGDHEHYRITDSTTDPVTLTVATGTEDYLEACRFKRINGIYRLVPDWRLTEINVFPDYFLATASAGLSSYQQYVKDRIQDAVFATSSASLPNADFNVGDGQSQQLLSRSLYMDDYSHDTNLQSYLDGYSSAASMAAGNWRQFVPFYEINSTLLALWRSTSEAVASVSSENIDTIQDTSLGYYGSYSRGVILGATGVTSGASTAIVAYSKEDNTGVLGNNYAETNPSPNPLAGIDNLIEPNVSEAEGSLTVTHGGACVGTCYLSGFIYENGAVDIDKTVLTVTATQGSCRLGSQTTGGAGNQISYSCSGVPVTGDVTITVTSAIGSGSVNKVYSVDPTAAASTGTSNASRTKTMAGVGATNVDFYLTVL